MIPLLVPLTHIGVFLLLNPATDDCEYSYCSTYGLITNTQGIVHEYMCAHMYINTRAYIQIYACLTNLIIFI